jgi:hypothetical protein
MKKEVIDVVQMLPKRPYKIIPIACAFTREMPMCQMPAGDAPRRSKRKRGLSWTLVASTNSKKLLGVSNQWSHVVAEIETGYMRRMSEASPVIKGSTERQVSIRRRLVRVIHQQRPRDRCRLWWSRARPRPCRADMNYDRLLTTNSMLVDGFQLTCTMTYLINANLMEHVFALDQLPCLLFRFEVA